METLLPPRFIEEIGRKLVLFYTSLVHFFYLPFSVIPILELSR